MLAYILNPLVSKLEAHGIKRARASMWVMLFALFLLTALLLVIVPMLVQQSQSIIQKLPQLADYLHHTALPWLNQKLGSNISLNSSTATAWLRSNAQNIQEIGNTAKNVGHECPPYTAFQAALMPSENPKAA